MNDYQYSQIVMSAKAIQAIPSLTFKEFERGKFLAAQFSALSLLDIHIDPIGNVYARIQGGNALPLVISAHLDCVLSPAEVTPLI